MTVAFWCPRLSMLRQFGPLALECRRRGERAMFLLPVGELAAGGPKDDASAAALLQFGDVEAVDSDASFLGACRRQAVGTVFHLGLRWPEALGAARAQLRVSDRIAFCAVGYHEEELLHLLADGPGRLKEWDAILTWDQAALDAAGAAYPASVSLLAQLQPLGTPLADQLALPGFGEGFRRALAGQIGTVARPGKKLVLFVPAATAHLLHPRWAGWWYRFAPWNLPWTPWGDLVPSHRLVAALVRQFCDRHGALMVVKERAKSPAPAWLRRMADAVVGDLSFYPSTMLEAMATADLAVGLAGGWAVEALICGTPTISILPYPQSAYEHPLLLAIRERLYRGPKGRWQVCEEAFTQEGWAPLQGWADRGTWPRTARLPVPEVFRPGASARILDAVKTLIRTQSLIPYEDHICLHQRWRDWHRLDYGPCRGS